MAPGYQSQGRVRVSSISLNLAYDSGRVANHPRPTRHVAHHDRTGLDKGASADSHTLENGRARSYPDITLDTHRPADDWRAWPPGREGRAGDGVRNPLGRGD